MVPDTFLYPRGEIIFAALPRLSRAWLLRLLQPAHWGIAGILVPICPDLSSMDSLTIDVRSKGQRKFKKIADIGSDSVDIEVAQERIGSSVDSTTRSPTAILRRSSRRRTALPPSPPRAPGGAGEFCILNYFSPRALVESTKKKISRKAEKFAKIGINIFLGFSIRQIILRLPGETRRRSYDPVCQHGVGDFDEAADVGAIDVIDHAVSCAAILQALGMDLFHDGLELFVDFLAGPTQA